MLDLVAWFFLIFILYRLAQFLKRKTAKPDFKGKTIWITGASSGIGEALANELNRLGGKLIISARNVKELERVKSECAHPENVRVVQLDMTDFEAVKKVTQEVIESLEKNGEKLDIIVENAGVSMRCEFKDYDFSNHLSMFNVNVNGPYLHLKCLIDHMIKNKSGQIVGISSAQAKLATGYRTSYAGSKHAITGILDSLRVELYDYGIHVTNILPGYVRTNVSKNAFGANAGEKFGETDKNISKGMSAEAFAKEAAQAIFLKENEAQICRQIDFPVGAFFRNICPDLVFYGLRLNAKKQSKVSSKTA